MNKPIAILALLALCAAAQAALPPPTAAQQQAAAEKKAKADAQAAKDKESLAASMDAVSTRWRSRAASEGWKLRPQVAIAAAPAAASAAPVTGAAPAGQPQGVQSAAAAALPIKSEKYGTAPPSEDIKAAPTRAVPAGTAPAVDKGSPDVSKKR